MNKKLFFIITISIGLFGCNDDVLPKPKAFLRLEYPKAEYEDVILPLPITFEKNKLSKPITLIKTIGDSKGIDIEYPSLNATIHLTYSSVKDNNLEKHIVNAQNLTQEHTIKADEIQQKEYSNAENQIFGMLYEVTGNAASQSQFYVTDSTDHFLSGSLYFSVKPNYDSIFPAAEYLKKDVKHLIESLKWTK